MEYDRNFIILSNLDITISICRTSIFYSDMTMVFYLNITINIIILQIQYLVEFSKSSFFSHCNYFLIFFRHIITVFTLYY